MSSLKTFSWRSFKPDRFLLMALGVGFLFCLYGITWEHGHPDDMAFRSLFLPGKLPFNPGWFHKPPFHTYFNYFLSTWPIDSLGNLLHLPESNLNIAKLVWSRMLASMLFLLSVCLVYRMTLKSFGIFPARVIAFIFSTSAGFITFSHFLTADIPVMFWMLVAFFFSFNILSGRKISDYLLAGFFTGIATATKYNGLAIGISLVVAHFFSYSATSWKFFDWRGMLFSRKIIFGLFMVPCGFVVGNPFCILDYRTFKNDFLYNYIVTPVYDGQTGHSYVDFFLRIIQTIGLPSFIITCIAFFYAVYLLFKANVPRIQKGTIIMSLSVLALYYFKFASFPRLETRFVLPLVPFFLLISGALWCQLRRQKIIFYSLLIIILSYNVVCNFYVGKRFSQDPRTVLLSWANQHLPEGSSVENDLYTPDLDKTGKKHLRQVSTPNIGGRFRIFLQMFKDNPLIVGSENDIKSENQEMAWYSLQQLVKRKTDFIGLNSLYYKRFTEAGLKRDLYPSMNQYFQDLLHERYPYKIVFDQESQRPPRWVYPYEIEFLHNRVTILARED